MMIAVQTTLTNALESAKDVVSKALADLLNWARAIPQDFWIITTFSLLGLVLIVVCIALTRPAAHKTRRARAEGAAPDAQMQSPQSSPTHAAKTHAAETQAALAQALDANEHHQEQIQALKNELDHWTTSLSGDSGDAATDAWLAHMKDALNDAHALVQALHQTAKTHQLNTINQSLDGSEATSDGASKALLDTMADWLKHHQALYETLAAIRTPLKSLQARQDSPGSVRHEAALKRIDALLRTLNGLERSLYGLGQDLKRMEQLMLGDR